MAASMTRRERVERAMALQDTDRVPVCDRLRCDAVLRVPWTTSSGALCSSRMPPGRPVGCLMDVMDDLVATDIDGLNPIETAAGMDLREVEQKYGKRLFLTGAAPGAVLSRGRLERSVTARAVSCSRCLGRWAR